MTHPTPPTDAAPDILAQVRTALADARSRLAAYRGIPPANAGLSEIDEALALLDGMMAEPHYTELQVQWDKPVSTTPAEADAERIAELERELEEQPTREAYERRGDTISNLTVRAEAASQELASLQAEISRLRDIVAAGDRLLETVRKSDA